MNFLLCFFINFLKLSINKVDFLKSKYYFRRFSNQELYYRVSKILLIRIEIYYIKYYNSLL